MQTQQNQKESAFSGIKKTLGLVQPNGKEGEQAEGQEEEAMDFEEESIDERDPFVLLEGQHREVDALFSEIEQAGERAHKTKERLVKTLMEKLNMHTDLEERIFYKAARAADEDLVLESYEEHAAMKNMLKRLAHTEAKDESFHAKLTVLKELVEHHVKEEENDLFPKCREIFEQDDLMELGEDMLARMEKLQDQARAKTRANRATTGKSKSKTTARKRTTRGKKRAA